MTSRVAIRIKVVCASLPQLPYVSTARGTHTQPSSWHLGSLAMCLCCSLWLAKICNVKDDPNLRIMTSLNKDFPWRLNILIQNLLLHITEGLYTCTYTQSTQNSAKAVLCSKVQPCQTSVVCQTKDPHCPPRQLPSNVPLTLGKSSLFGPLPKSPFLPCHQLAKAVDNGVLGGA